MQYFHKKDLDLRFHQQNAGLLSNCQIEKGAKTAAVSNTRAVHRMSANSLCAAVHNFLHLTF